MDVIIVCHTESGFVANNKRLIYKKEALRGVEEGVFNLLKTAEKYGAKISFMVMPEVFEFFPKGIIHETGLHVHPGWQEFSSGRFKWIVGDKYLSENCPQNKVSTLLADYSHEDQLEIIKTGRAYFIKNFGFEPKTFLAGRWSLNASTMKILKSLNFTHDCSAYPGLIGWKNLPRICMPYEFNGILEVPVSRLPLKGAVCLEEVRRIGLLGLKICFKEYYWKNKPLFHIALHSPAMTDDFYISAMDKFLFFISQHKNINFKFVSQA